MSNPITDIDITTVVGTHCYLGAMLEGVKQHQVKVVATYEGWKHGKLASSIMGNNVLPMEDRALLVYPAGMTMGNPPCSRFSALSFSAFKKHGPGAYNDITQFPDLQHVLETTIASGSKVMWWETGPMAWTRGLDFVQQMHDQLAAHWGKCTTLMVRLDLLWLGVPHQRPRMHIIHMATDQAPPVLPASVWEFKQNVRQYVADAIGSRPLTNPIYHHPTMTPHEYVAYIHVKSNFNGTKPVIVNEDANYTPSVVSGRFWTWRDDPRFWDLLEYGVMMGIDLDKLQQVIDAYKNPGMVLALISKGVSASASSFIYSQVIKPWVEGSTLTEGVTPFESEIAGIFKADLKQKGVSGMRNTTVKKARVATSKP